MTRQTILLAFSGGIDSCYTALTLTEAGYQVIGLNLQLYTTEDTSAARAAREMGIELLTLDLREEFRETIIRNFIEEYCAGRTPAPCALCNRLIKWRHLAGEADRLGVEKIATGHYIRIHKEGDNFFVKKAVDPVKDQSYFLWDLPQDILRRAVTPMGEVIKKKAAASLPPDLRPRESMGVCFLQGGPYAEFIKANAQRPIPKGAITDTEGYVIGQHDGLAFYTIGQKRGMPTGHCVIGIDNQKNIIIAGGDRNLLHSGLVLTGCNIPDPEKLTSAGNLEVKVRGYGRNPDGGCREIVVDGDRIRLVLEQPALAPAPGQPVVIYRDDFIVGGGILQEVFD